MLFLENWYGALSKPANKLGFISNSPSPGRHQVGVCPTFPGKKSQRLEADLNRWSPEGGRTGLNIVANVVLFFDIMIWGIMPLSRLVRPVAKPPS